MVHVMKFQSFEAEEHATEALEHIPKCHASVWKAKKKKALDRQPNARKTPQESIANRPSYSPSN